MTGLTSSLPLVRRADLERRFDGPIPVYLLDTSAAQHRRYIGARRLIAAMTAAHRQEVWRQLTKMKIAFEIAARPAAAFHRARLDAAARNLASLVMSPGQRSG